MGGLTRRGFIGGATAGAGLLLLRAPGSLAAPPVAPRLSHGPDGTSSMTVAWSTPGDVSGLRADVGVDGSLGQAVAVETRAVDGHTVRYHRAAVTGLAPGTTYRYRVAHDGGEYLGTFSTAPAAGTRAPFSFVAFGDQGDGDAAVAVDGLLATLDPALVFVVGDLSYASKTGGLTPSGVVPPTVDHGTWDAWLALTSSSGAAATPWLAGVGNHEIEDGQGELGYDGYLARVPLPGNGPDGVPTAWVARHDGVAFVNLDANDVSHEITRNRGWTGGAQTAWLDSTLAGLRADPTVDFVVVGFHHCAYCTNLVHASDGGVRDEWSPLFDAHGVDLVVNGHNHCYERAHPLKGGEPVTEVASGATFDSAGGTTYVTAGGGGQASYPTFAPEASYVTTVGGVRLPELAPWSAVRDPANSLLHVAVDPNGADGRTATMTATARAADGSVLDTFVLRRTRPAPAVAAAALEGATPSVAATSSTPAPRGGLPATGIAPLVGAAAAATAAGLAARRAGRMD